VAGTIGKLEAQVHGSGDLEVRGVQTQSLRVALDGPGSMKLSGSTGMLEASVSGSGDFDGEALTAGRAVLRGHGPGNIDLRRVTDTLDAELHGSGDLTARTEAKSVRLTLAGPGGAHLEGRTARLTAQLTGSGNIDGSALQADQAQVSVRGPGNAVVTVAGKVETFNRADASRLVTMERDGTH
jgi:hypothetical protein